MLLCKWNWKSAVLSSWSRGFVFFLANASAGLDEALGAMAAEFVYRAVSAGFYGTITQSFRGVRPAWRSLVASMVLLPLISHSTEFLVHYARGTEKLALSIFCSACFTALSTGFNLFAMRRGALIVEAGSDSLFGDLRRMPAILLEFVVAMVRTTRGGFRRWAMRAQQKMILARILTGQAQAAAPHPERPTCAE
jgi:hypothetical protein